MKKRNIYDSVYYVAMIGALMNGESESSFGGYTLHYEMYPTKMVKDGKKESYLALVAALVDDHTQMLEWKETFYKPYQYDETKSEEDIITDLISQPLENKADFIMQPAIEKSDRPYWRKKSLYLYDDYEDEDGYHDITFILFPRIPGYVAYNIKALAQGYLGELSRTILNGKLKDKVYEKEA